MAGSCPRPSHRSSSSGAATPRSGGPPPAPSGVPPDGHGRCADTSRTIPALRRWKEEPQTERALPDSAAFPRGEPSPTALPPPGTPCLLASFPSGGDGGDSSGCPIFATEMQFDAKNTLILSSAPAACSGVTGRFGPPCRHRGGNPRGDRVKARGSRRAGRSRIRRPQSSGAISLSGPCPEVSRRPPSPSPAGPSGRGWRFSTGSGPDI